jgi:hypothetical protein
MNNTWQMIPTAVVATAPSATITVAPNQTTLLAYGDVASPINYTVRFVGAKQLCGGQNWLCVGNLP